MTSSTSREDFNKVFPALVQDISEHAKQYNIPAPALEWLQKNLNENTPGGKLNRGLSVPDTALALLEKPLTEEQFKHLGLLGWMTELLQAFFLVSDDIMGQLDHSPWRAMLKHFRSHPAYINLVELFHETTFQTELGQLCDLITAPEDNVDLNNFNMDKFNFIVIYKTAYYSFYLPVALALHYLQLATPKNLRQAHDILIPLGQYFQAQDDYLDVFGKPEQIGKIGTDIQDNKCSWVVNQALKRCTPAQRKVLDECYGRKDAAMEAKVKAVFNEMNLQKVYHDFEEEQVSKLKSMIASIDTSEGLKGSVFEIFLAKIYKRDK
ncbi:farnesyl pyrophosphate synthetase [Trichophyton tonsurans CBS 112818]|uniref:Farnesyl pyrophosphate synthetase n=1 Tax=Trichophyton tonsurans (strain CBS 112818) TaxID=647933 RepID=F2RP05_TRIT1|nr:farnesyl pyrophosphate synthetase [Trichophyton tonsurans CBS 112818]